MIGQDPAEGEEVPPGSQVDLVRSPSVPAGVGADVVGETFDDAEERLAGSRLTAKRAEAFSDSVPAGEVIRQDPVSGEEAPRDSEVTVVVSKGPDIVEVPDVRGEDVEDAVRQLEALGFEVDVVGFRFDRPVRRRGPGPGKEVRRGETVTFICELAQEPRNLRKAPGGSIAFRSAVLGSRSLRASGGRSVCECRVVFPSRHRARMP